MNTPSFWNCFPWNRTQKQQVNDERRLPGRNQDRCSGSNADAPNEQFANLLGGELLRLFCESLFLCFMFSSSTIMNFWVGMRSSLITSLFKYVVIKN